MSRLVLSRLIAGICVALPVLHTGDCQADFITAADHFESASQGITDFTEDLSLDHAYLIGEGFTLLRMYHSLYTGTPEDLALFNAAQSIASAAEELRLGNFSGAADHFESASQGIADFTEDLSLDHAYLIGEGFTQLRMYHPLYTGAPEDLALFNAAQSFESAAEELRLGNFSAAADHFESAGQGITDFTEDLSLDHAYLIGEGFTLLRMYHPLYTGAPEDLALFNAAQSIASAAEELRATSFPEPSTFVPEPSAFVLTAETLIIAYSARRKRCRTKA